MTPAAEARIRRAVEELADAILAALADREGAGPERLLSVAEAAEIAGIGRTRLYLELNSGRIRSVQSGRRRLIPESALSEFAGAGPPPEAK